MFIMCYRNRLFTIGWLYGKRRDTHSGQILGEGTISHKAVNYGADDSTRDGVTLMIVPRKELP
jgi:hypothetical protein